MMDDIPFSCVPMMTWQSLANKLDPDSPLMGNNWKMLAEKLGYTTEQILCLESRHTSHGRNTLKLFEEYVKKRDSTVKNLKKALEEMDRPDALQVLLDAMPDIEQQYQREMNNRRVKSEPDENSWPASCQSSCSSAFYNGRIPAQNQSIIHQHQQFHHQIPAHTYSTAIHPPSYMPSISHIGMSGGTVRHVQEKELNIPQNPNYYSQHVNPTSHYRSNTNHQATSRVHHSPNSRIHNTSHSMVVHVDPQEIVANIGDIDMADMTEMNIPVTEDPTPLPVAIGRGQNMNVPRLMNPQDMLVGREVTIGTSSSPQPETTCQFPNRYERQVSEECNSRQPSSIDNCNKGNKVGLSIQCSKGKTGNKQNCEFVSPGATPTSVPSTPLGKLQQFTNSESYMPTEQYQTMMEEKLREEVLYNRAYTEEVHNKLRAENQHKKNGDHSEDSFRSIFKFNRSSQIQAVKSQNNMTSLKSCVEKEIPKTFPLRAKSLGSCSSENSQDRPSILPKSQSLPDDMKPVEYKRAFRHIKVFVTYSDDCKRHLQRVLNLCRCLEKNGFTCCMDMYGRKMQVNDKVGWLDQRFKEADFILVCVSPGYKSEIDNFEIENTHELSDDALHTRYIYKLMMSEFQDNGQRNVRFVPLMFESATPEHIPSWLENGLLYAWPTQYRDLLWFLTKPETRVKSRNKANVNENSPKSPDSPFSGNDF